MIRCDAFPPVFMRINTHKCDKCDKGVTRFRSVFIRGEGIRVTLVTGFRNNYTYARDFFSYPEKLYKREVCLSSRKP